MSLERYHCNGIFLKKWLFGTFRYEYKYGCLCSWIFCNYLALNFERTYFRCQFLLSKASQHIWALFYLVFGTSFFFRLQDTINFRWAASILMRIVAFVYDHTAIGKYFSQNLPVLLRLNFLTLYKLEPYLHMGYINKTNFCLY